jgi:predicted nucleic acid-binding Zn ribbon protein
MQLRNDSACLIVESTLRQSRRRHKPMNSIIYIVGLIVIVMAILSFIGLA